jgi:predicted alpha-1,2-mannosidase
MKNIRPLLYLILVLLNSCSSDYNSNSLMDLQHLVDPLIGTGFHGHTYPGPSAPHGQIQLSPDTHILGWEASSGYHYDDSTLYGFSHNHLSGTGIGDLGDFLFLPFTGSVNGVGKPVGILNHSLEKAALGFYQILLQPWNIDVQLTASERVGWHQYTYPQDAEAQVMLDLSHVLQPNWGHRLDSATFEWVDSFTIRAYRQTSGWAHFDPVWMYARFDHPIQEVKSLEPGRQTAQAETVFLNFGRLQQPLNLKVSLSNTSPEGALANYNTLSENLSFEEVRINTITQWNNKLAAIEIVTSDSSVLKNFYTSLYHTHLAPLLFSDADGTYRGLDQEIHQNKTLNRYSAYSLWDVFRSWGPLMTILEPASFRNWCYDLLNQYREGGLLPKWPLQGNYTGTMVGYPAVALFYDALQKDLIDTLSDEFLKAGLVSSQWQPEFVEKHKGTRAERVMPLPIYYKENYDYIPYNKIPESVSYGLEMSFYDWCISGMAQKLGKNEIHQKYLNKANAYRHYFDPSVGFMRGRHEDGTWEPNFDPNYSEHLNGPFVEGNSWQWTPFVLHDPQGLQELMGGPRAFGDWLDQLFTTSSEVSGANASMDITGLIGQYAHGNEPSHHVPYLYRWTDRPWKTNQILDTILYNFYEPSPEGIIGNEDCGQMSAWYILNAIGLYQMTPGNPTFFIGRPIVEEAKIRLNQGYFTIKVHGNSRTNKYLEKAKLNGTLLKEFSIDYSVIQPGGQLEIWMTDRYN